MAMRIAVVLSVIVVTVAVLPVSVGAVVSVVAVLTVPVDRALLTAARYSLALVSGIPRGTVRSNDMAVRIDGTAVGQIPLDRRRLPVLILDVDRGRDSRDCRCRSDDGARCRCTVGTRRRLNRSYHYSAERRGSDAGTDDVAVHALIVANNSDKCR